MESGFPGKRFGGRWKNADTREVIDSFGGWLCDSQVHPLKSLKGGRTSLPLSWGKKFINQRSVKAG
jgi:hypothetical protein